MALKYDLYELLGLSVDPPETDPGKVLAAFKECEKKINSSSSTDDEDIKRLKRKFLKQDPLSSNGGGWPRELAQLTLEKIFTEYANTSAPPVFRQNVTELLTSCAAERRMNLIQQIQSLAEELGDKGYLTAVEAANLATKFSHLAKKTVDDVFAKLKLKVRDQAISGVLEPVKPPDTSLPNPINQVQFEDIVKVADQLGANDIYAKPILDCVDTASIKALNEALEKMTAEINKNPLRPENSARKAFRESFKKIFASEETKKAFDSCWTRHRRDTKLKDKFRMMVMKGQRSIAEEDYLHAIKLAKKEGCTQAEAEWEVYYFFCKGQKLPFPLRKPVEPRQICPICRNDETLDTVICRQCGAPLRVKCPKCTKDCHVSDRHCQCGFAVGSMPLAVKHLDAARQNLAKQDWDAAERDINAALLYWPGNPKAEDLKAQVHAGRQHQAQQADAARKAQAKEAEAKRQAQVQAWLAAMKPPAQLAASPTSGHSIQLTWPPASFTGQQPPHGVMTYRVVRKANALPSAPGDGETLVETVELSHVDTTAVPGVIYGYAVYPCCQGIPSPRGAGSSKTMTPGGPPTVNSTPAPDGNAVALSWKAAGQPAEIRIYQRRGGPCPSPDSNTRPHHVVDGKTTEWEDTALDDGIVYGYRIRPMYRAADQSLVAGGDTVVQETPMTLPPIVDALECTVEDGGLRVSWTPLQDAEVRIYMGDKPLETDNRVIADGSPRLSSFCASSSVNQAAGWALFPGRHTRQIFFTPVVFKGRMGRVCQAKAFISGVKNLRAKRAGDELHVTWEWPDGCQECLVSFRTDRFPESPDDTNANKTMVKRAGYGREDVHVIRRAGGHDYYFAVFACCTEPQGNVWSSPAHELFVGAQTTIVCTLKKKRKLPFFRGRQKLAIRIVDGAASLPPLVLVQRTDRHPLSRRDGQEVAKIDTKGKREHIEPLPEGCKPGLYVGLFVDRAEDERRYKILKPDDMRV